MSMYDDYFTNEDKPFAENLNDALLLSNVFDLTVTVETPKMFRNSEWVNNNSPRKCSVAILTLKEGLPTGVAIDTDSEGNSILTGTGTVKLSYYPNFNSFGSFKSISWENDGSITVNLLKKDGTVIASNINKGTIESQSSELRKLQEIIIELVFNNATLHSLTVIMENKQQERYGATVGISDVTGLSANLAAITSKDISQDSRLDALDVSMASAVSDIADLKGWTRYDNDSSELPKVFMISSEQGGGYLLVNEELRLANLSFYYTRTFEGNKGQSTLGVFMQDDYLPNRYLFFNCHGSGDLILTVPYKNSAHGFTVQNNGATGNRTIYVDVLYKF